MKSEEESYEYELRAEDKGCNLLTVPLDFHYLSVTCPAIIIEVLVFWRYNPIS